MFLGARSALIALHVQCLSPRITKRRIVEVCIARS
jgi:hypothetical protein